MTAPQADRLLFLSRSSVRELAAENGLFVEGVERALSLHARGATVQPLKPYLRPAGADSHIADRIIAMPGSLAGEDAAVGIKWVASKHDNPSARGIPRASALIVLNDPDTYRPVALLEGTEISAMRTAAVTVAAARRLARPGFSTLGLVGCGVIGQAHVGALLAAFPQIERISLYDTDRPAAQRLADSAARPGVRCTVSDSAHATVNASELVVTATVTDAPYIEADWLAPGAFLSNVSIMDVSKEAHLRVDKLVIDDWDQSNREGKILHQLTEEGRISRADVHAELGEILIGDKPGRESADERILLSPMGMAIEDIACAEAIYRRALETGAGTWLELE
jgi:N-[(2S)-2-amino-2-carboxyethyl]-L-glutamate dehydrogenase